MNKFYLALLISLLAVNSQASLTGTYNISGDPNNNAVDNGNGTFGLTSTASTYSWVDLVLTQPVTFSQLTDLEAVFTANGGGAGGGAPRLVLDLSNGGDINVLLGTAPDYIDSDTSLNSYSGVNLIGNNDAGRYDTSNDGLTGGSPYTTYSGALAQAGGLTVTDIAFVVDGGWATSATQDITLNSIEGVPVPEPSTILASVAMLLPFSASTLRLLRKRTE